MMRRILAAFALGLASLSLAAEGWPPAGKPVRVPVVRDTWVSSCSGETQGNNGGANTLKTKAYQEFFILDIDPAPLKGRVVTGAILHLHCTSKDIQKRLAVSSLASEWVEGTGTGYAKQPGSSCFEEAELGKRPWAYPGSDMTAVMMAEGNTAWATWDATPPDADGWQTVAVAPRVVAARIAGVSHGFVVFDDTGSEWTRRGESFQKHIFPNRFVGRQDRPLFHPLPRRRRQAAARRANRYPPGAGHPPRRRGHHLMGNARRHGQRRHPRLRHPLRQGH